MRVYLAGSIFYAGDVYRNTDWAARIRAAIPSIDLYNPLEADFNGPEGKKRFAGSRIITDGDCERLHNTDVLVVCMDGDVIPAGSSCEIGIMSEKIRNGAHKHIIGICTDNRQCYLTHSEEKDKGGAAELGEQQYSYQNLFVTGIVKQSGVMVSSIEEAIEVLKEYDKEDYGEC